MKKNTTAKRFGLTAAALIVCLAMLVTCFTFVAPIGISRSAFAEPVANATLFDGFAVQSTCDYGDKFSVPVGGSGVDVTVTKPDGTNVELGTAVDGNYSVYATQLGNYTVKYTSGEMTYSYRVYVSLDKDYILRVDDNGADIPTYIKKGDTFTVPDAKIAYYEDNVLTAYPGNVALTVTDSYGKTYAPGDTYEATTNGKVYLTYSARMDGANGEKYFNKTFTINVQSEFSDTIAPSITVSGVTSDASVNRSVTLPKATATDSNDENVKIVIEVTDPNGNKVRRTDLDKNGYAYQDAKELEADEAADAANDSSRVRVYPYVEFDNDQAMIFYPVYTGQYKVAYQAYDDAGNASTRREFTINVADLAAPVINDVAENLIPETWGITVKKADPDNKGETIDVEDTTITFKVPEVVDNKDHAYPLEGVENDTDLISMSFRITDADNSKTIVEFTNILAVDDEDGNASSDATFTADSVYGEEGVKYVFNKDNDFKFDFTLYNKTDATGEVSLPGTYTVLFRAKDKANNTSSKTYTITLQEEYVDDAVPTHAEVTVPAYIAETEKTFVIPSPIAADASDSRPYVLYRVYSDNELALEENGRYITVKGGEEAELVTEGGKRYLYINRGESYEQVLELGTNMYFYVYTADKVGNYLSNVKDEDGNSIDLDVAGNEELYVDSDAVVKVIKTGVDATLTYSSGISFDSDIIAGDKVNAGGFSIVTDEDMRYYTGFEVSIYDPNGNTLKDVTLETFSTVTGAQAYIYVKNISFTASMGGNHYMTVRALNVNGKSIVNAYSFNVTQKSVIGPGTTAIATFGSAGAANVTYKLHNEQIENVGAENSVNRVVRQIRGGVFTLIGNEITMKDQVTYYVSDGWIDEDNISNYDTFDNTEIVTPYGKTYSMSVTDNAAPVIEVLGVMPSYAPKYDKDNAENTMVNLPVVIAYTENGNAVVDIKITDKDSKNITPTKNDDNSYSFKGEKDGVYTVTYTATYGSATAVTATYSINVGDVVGPEFKYTGGTTGVQTIGDLFTFGVLELTDPAETTTGVTVTKKLIDPSHSEVTSATVSGSFSSNADKTNNGTDIELSMYGTYEVVYTVTDSVGNSTVLKYSFNVSGSGSTSSSSMTWLSTTLIIIAVILLAGVIVYVVRFRKVKK